MKKSTPKSAIEESGDKKYRGVLLDSLFYPEGMMRRWGVYKTVLCTEEGGGGIRSWMDESKFLRVTGSGGERAAQHSPHAGKYEISPAY